MGYCLNHLDEPVFIAVTKLMLTDFGIHHRLESCGLLCSLEFLKILVTKLFCSGLLGRVSMSSNSSTFSQSICLLLCSRKIGSSLEKDLISTTDALKRFIQLSDFWKTLK